MKRERLSKILAAYGIASRRESEKIITHNRVKVNGKIQNLPQYMVECGKDEILLDGKKLLKKEKKVYYLLNKPKKFVCSNRRLFQEKLVIDLFEDGRKLFTVGRLDKETTGLIIVTNDGEFAQKIMHPSHKIDKEYLVRVKEFINLNHLKSISAGIIIDKRLIKPIKVRKVRKNVVKIIIQDGKKHEIRKFIKNAGLNILELTRIRIGSLLLGNQLEGSYKNLSQKEISELLK